ncbi:MAG TPA: YraN family protein [Rhizomicrobium sp.]|jgi:putative endonuclease|nr:YraN family protein [Rhizomicrobium sp.]
MPDAFTGRRQQAEKRGRRGETLASLLLMLKGYRILGRRVKTHAGEIDLIAQAPGGLVCFIEVKARPDRDTAVGAVHQRQQQRIMRAAGLFLAARPKLATRPVRYDIVTVMPGALPRHIRDAFRSGG